MAGQALTRKDDGRVFAGVVVNKADRPWVVDLATADGRAALYHIQFMRGEAVLASGGETLPGFKPEGDEHFGHLPDSLVGHVATQQW
ncbi:MAG: hypothetical protein R3C68_17590 [Myxococcota bacterium]